VSARCSHPLRAAAKVVDRAVERFVGPAGQEDRTDPRGWERVPESRNPEISIDMNISSPVPGLADRPGKDLWADGANWRTRECLALVVSCAESLSQSLACSPRV
jgi:hypothetical protein